MPTAGPPARFALGLENVAGATVLSENGNELGMLPPPSEGVANAAWRIGPDMLVRAYTRYFASGLYEERYPRPNRTTLARLQDLTPKGGTVLDFGCGTGRYALALLSTRPDVRIIAYDPCPEAIARLREAVAGSPGAGRLTLVGGSFDDCLTALPSRGCDVVALLFGVLGHVAGRLQRRAILEGLAGRLTPGGRVVLGLPNRRRRFLQEQRAAPGPGLEAGDVLYQRQREGERIELFYHLYDVPEIALEMEAAGLVVEALVAESILPETMLSRRPALAPLDGLLRAVTPVPLAYGWLVVGRRGRAAGEVVG